MLTWLVSLISEAFENAKQPARDMEAERYWQERRAVSELLAARGFTPCFDPYRTDTSLFALRDRELEFIREGDTTKVFTGKWAYMHPATNIADLWWRIPDMGKQDARVIN